MKRTKATSFGISIALLMGVCLLFSACKPGPGGDFFLKGHVLYVSPGSGDTIPAGGSSLRLLVNGTSYSSDFAAEANGSYETIGLYLRNADSVSLEGTFLHSLGGAQHILYEGSMALSAQEMLKVADGLERDLILYARPGQHAIAGSAYYFDLYQDEWVAMDGGTLRLRDGHGLPAGEVSVLDGRYGFGPLTSGSYSLAAEFSAEDVPYSATIAPILAADSLISARNVHARHDAPGSLLVTVVDMNGAAQPNTRVCLFTSAALVDSACSHALASATTQGPLGRAFMDGLVPDGAYVLRAEIGSLVKVDTVQMRPEGMREKVILVE